LPTEIFAGHTISGATYVSDRHRNRAGRRALPLASVAVTVIVVAAAADLAEGYTRRRVLCDRGDHRTAVVRSVRKAAYYIRNHVVAVDAVTGAGHVNVGIVTSCTVTVATQVLVVARGVRYRQCYVVVANVRTVERVCIDFKRSGRCRAVVRAEPPSTCAAVIVATVPDRPVVSSDPGIPPSAPARPFTVIANWHVAVLPLPSVAV
jgi:hypothetical protein